MSDLTTLPSSERQYILSSTLPQPSETEDAFKETIVTLAKTNPDLCVALIAAHLNQSSLGAAEEEESTERTSNAIYMFGI